MKRKIRFIIVSLILLVVIGINISYAISLPDIPSNTSTFFEVNERELSTGETLEMTIDLSKINYEEFQFKLSSNLRMDKVYTDETIMVDSDIMLDTETNKDITININKQNLNLSKIVLYYQIPENIEFGTKIQLNAQIIMGENSELIDEKQIEINIVEENKVNDDNKNQEDNKNKEDTTDKEDMNGQENNKLPNNFNGDSIQDTQVTNTNNVSSSTNNLQSISNNASQSYNQTETATYNGSNNNYLSSLEIEGIELTSDFNKEKLTYFAETESLETITVIAEAEDSSSKVAITGTNLKSGENKVLISVTAENGDVRYYRIYVTNN